MPASYGDSAAEATALRTGCALWDGSAAGRLEMTGDDRHRFLNGLVTAELLQPEPGSSRYGLFTSIKGRVLADVTVIVDADRIWLRLPPGRAEIIRRHMAQYVIVDRVELNLLGGMLPIVLAGPQAERRLNEWCPNQEIPTPPGSHAVLTVLDTDVHLLREKQFGFPAFSLWVPEPAAGGLVTGLLQSATPPIPVGLGAIEAARINAGVPRFGVDFGEDTFPQEAALDSAVSYEKGCYLGQEIVARIHFRGGVNRILRGLELGPDVELAPGAVVVAHGREVGRVTSVAPAGGGVRRALAMLAVTAAEPGGCVEVASGTAEVLELPFGLD